MSERILVAMSGGVDSSVTAGLLAEAGHEVIGLFMRTGVKGGPNSRSCCSATDAADARRVASILDVPFYAIDYQGAFEKIMDRFVEEYDRGRTPIPCALCNQWVKFGELIEFADGIGADAVATGHYARVREEAGRHVLSRPADETKDQTYFLFGLSQAQLARSRFPLADRTKEEVRAEAARLDLPVRSKPESMEVCFIPSNDYRTFLRKRAPDAMEEGEIVDLEGNVLGTHEGHQAFTIGQRRGLGIALGHPVYVVAIDAENNRVVVGEADDLMDGGLVAEDANWIAREPPSPGERIPCRAQIRHNHEPVRAEVEPGPGPGEIVCRFAEPERAVTPGQAAVLWSGGDVLCGGWIREALPVEDGPSRRSTASSRVR